MCSWVIRTEENRGTFLFACVVVEHSSQRFINYVVPIQPISRYFMGKYDRVHGHINGDISIRRKLQGSVKTYFNINRNEFENMQKA